MEPPAPKVQASFSCPDVATVLPGNSVTDAARSMCERNIGCLVVVDETGRAVGILTERDVLNRVVARGSDPSSRQVCDVMTADMVWVPPETAPQRIQHVMATHKVRHLPILSDGMPVGLVSSRDVMAYQMLRDRAMRVAAERVAMLPTALKSLDLDEVIGMALREVPRIFGARRCVLYLPGVGSRGHGSVLVARHACPCSDRDLVLRRPWNGRSSCPRVIFGASPEACAAQVGQSPHIVVPLEVGTDVPEGGARSDRSCGYLCLCDIELSDDLSGQLAQYEGALVREILTSNLTNAYRYQEMERRSMTDSLTYVSSRRFFEERLEAECDRAARYRRPFCVAMIDVDHFKAINDRLGHQVGDKALGQLAICLERMKRASDVLARYGGDEFVLLMPETARDDAVRVLDRLRQEVTGVTLPDGRPLAVSCGAVEQAVGSNVSANELVRRADMALYHAKKRGRNRTETWERISRGVEYDDGIEKEKVRQLEVQVAELSGRTREMFAQSLWSLAQALEARDSYTRSHSENVMRYAVGIAETLNVSRDECLVLRRAAVMHDIGKIGVPDAILRKPGSLTHTERRVMEQHPLIAVAILDEMRFLEREIPLVRHHHEHWDGRGYPDGFAGQKIPFGARILAVADALDALTSDRVYRPARPLAQTTRILLQDAGTQFDPEVIDAMIRWVEHVRGQTGRASELTCRDLLNSQEACVLAA